MTNKLLIPALIAWTGLLAVVVAALVLFSDPPPISAQTGVTAFGSVRVGAFYRAYPRTALTVTMNGWLTPTGTYQRIQNASGAVSTSGAKIAVKPAGTLLYLVNVGANSITFTETSITSAGNIVLGAGDSATLISDGSAYTQIGASNN